MGNDQPVHDVAISPKITNAINSFKDKLSGIESAKERRALILECKVPKQFDNEFNLNQWIHIARYVLQNDTITANIRQKCVPSLIKETEFWKRYFFLVREEKKKKHKKKRSKHKHKPKTSTSTSPTTKSKEEQQAETNKKPEKEEEDEDADTYQVLLHKPIIWLYKIPATIWRGRNNKCELWGLRNPIWMGRLRIVAFKHGKHLQFQFLEKDGKLFLKSTLIKLDEITEDDTNPIHQYFDAYGVIDSSRYFIIWVDVPNKTRIPFGFGIRERQDAFDIRAAVADQMKIVRREINGEHALSDDAENDGQSEYKSLNDGDTVSDDGDEDGVSEYEWKTDEEYKEEEVVDEMERKCEELEDGQKKWMKKVKVKRKRERKKKRKNRFKLDEDEMISIGHDIDNVDHQIDLHSKHKHSTILKVKVDDIQSNGVGDGDNDELYLLPPPPSPPLTPQDELTHIDDVHGHIMKNQGMFKVEYNDEDFGEFQIANDVDNEDGDGTVGDDKGQGKDDKEGVGDKKKEVQVQETKDIVVETEKNEEIQSDK